MNRPASYFSNASGRFKTAGIILALIALALFAAGIRSGVISWL